MGNHLGEKHPIVDGEARHRPFEKVIIIMDLPPELTEQVLSHLSTVDLGNLAIMTCREMRDWLDPKLAGRLNHLVWANPNLVQLIRPQQPESYGITERDTLVSGDLDETEALVVRDNLRDFTEDLYACPMLGKYVKHLFIDYRKLSPANDGFYGFDEVEHVEQLMHYLELEKLTNRDYYSGFWTSECGLAAMVMLKLTNVESLVLVGCNSRGFEHSRDPITAALPVALSSGCHQKGLRSLKYIYALGCLGSYGLGYAPWDFAVLPSVKTLECQEIRAPSSVTLGCYGKDDNNLVRRAPGFDRVFQLETLVIRQQGLDRESFFKILKYTPYLKRLSYQRVYFGRIKWSIAHQGLHLAKLRRAIQPLSNCLEELTIEVEAVQDLWGSNSLQYSDVESDEEDGLYYDTGDKYDGEDEDDSDEENNSDDDEIEGKKELDSLSLTEELDQLEQRHGTRSSLWSAEGIRNIPNVPIEDIRACLGSFSHESEIVEPSWDDQQPEFLGSLAHFTKLRNVTVPAILLQDPWPYPGHRRDTSATIYSNGTAMAGARKHLKDLLPKSIERLTLFKLQGTGSPCAICLF